MLTFLVLALFTFFFLLRVPVAIAMIVASLIVVLVQGEVPLVVLPQFIVTGTASFELLAVPFFILAAELMSAGGITERIFNCALVLVGRIPGGLAHVAVISSVIFAGISHTAIGDIAGLGRVQFKILTKHGYDPGFTCGLTLASCVIGPLVPPSVAVILFAIVGNVSIGRMLLAGIIPGVVVTLCIMGYVYWLVWSGRIKAPPVEPIPWRDAVRYLIGGIPAIIAPVVLVGGIIGGIVTTTESGVAACLYSFLVAKFFYKELTLARLREAMVNATMSTGMVMLLVGAGTLMAWIVTVDQSALAVAKWFVGLTSHRWLQLLYINIFLMIVGGLIEGIPALLILVPVLLPIAVKLGVDPVQFGLIFTFNMLMGLLTPPAGLGLFVMSKVSGVSVERVTMAALPFHIPLLVTLALITYVPWFSLYLPNLLFP